MTESNLFTNDSSLDFTLKNNVLNIAHKAIIIAKPPNTIITIAITPFINLFSQLTLPVRQMQLRTNYEDAIGILVLVRLHDL